MVLPARPLDPLLCSKGPFPLLEEPLSRLDGAPLPFHNPLSWLPSSEGCIDCTGSEAGARPVAQTPPKPRASSEEAKSDSGGSCDDKGGAGKRMPLPLSREPDPGGEAIGGVRDAMGCGASAGALSGGTPPVHVEAHGCEEVGMSPCIEGSSEARPGGNPVGDCNMAGFGSCSGKVVLESCAYNGRSTSHV